MANAPFVLVEELTLDCLGAADVVFWNWPDVAGICIFLDDTLLELMYLVVEWGVCMLGFMIKAQLAILDRYVCRLSMYYMMNSMLHYFSSVICSANLVLLSGTMGSRFAAAVISFALLRLEVDVVAITELLNAAGVWRWPHLCLYSCSCCLSPTG
ncbi:hypothetical protein Nepgr_014700 [Nepenthes gracilis]|uniref:Uncharacterized protein n=1 Tax=Nepenthes gracilis TaxID=150966 RepID=A0AAD3SLG8_NEPGR|nr:hypothetical protein Nepgr_014700 [Nepenthes gracilis]